MVMPAAAARAFDERRERDRVNARAYRPIAETGVEPDDEAFVSRSRS